MLYPQTNSSAPDDRPLRLLAHPVRPRRQRRLSGGLRAAARSSPCPPVGTISSTSGAIIWARPGIRPTFALPWGWRGQRIFVRFNSVNYLAEVWLNGERLGEHEGGHLPFAFDITDRVQDADNVLVVRVNGELAPDHVPPGNLAGQPGSQLWTRRLPRREFRLLPLLWHSAPGADLHAAAGRDHRHDRDDRRSTGRAASSRSKPRTPPAMG